MCNSGHNSKENKNICCLLPQTTIQYFSEIRSHGSQSEGEGLRLSSFFFPFVSTGLVLTGHFEHSTENIKFCSGHTIFVLIRKNTNKKLLSNSNITFFFTNKPILNH